MASKNYEDAVQTLKDRFGGRWEGNEAEGRDEMAKILRDELGFSAGEANDTIDAMVASNQIRYHATLNPDTPADRELPQVGPTEGMITSVPSTSGMGGMPMAPGMLPAAGYWEVGEGATEDAAPGRAGQVTPDGL